MEEQQASGRYAFTREDVEGGLGGSSVAVQTALRRLKQKGRIASPRRGFYAVVPPEYRAAGCPPASWFIDDLMKNLDRRYYVGVLTAAALHGAGHQQPMAFQVIADRATRPMKAGRVRVEVHTRRSMAPGDAGQAGRDGDRNHGGRHAGDHGFRPCAFLLGSGVTGSDVAMVLSELAEKYPTETDSWKSPPHVRLPDVQRLGYLLALVGEGELAEPLAGWLAHRRTTVVRLRTDRPKGNADVDPRWRLISNEHLDIDL